MSKWVLWGLAAGLLPIGVGCSGGYEVDIYNYYPCVSSTPTLSTIKKFEAGECAESVKWQCTRQTPIFFRDVRIAICDTTEECTRICLERSGK